MDSFLKRAVRHETHCSLHVSGSSGGFPLKLMANILTTRNVISRDLMLNFVCLRGMFLQSCLKLWAFLLRAIKWSMYLLMLKFWFRPPYPQEKMPIRKVLPDSGCSWNVSLPELCWVASLLWSVWGLSPKPRANDSAAVRRFCAPVRLAGWDMSKPSASARASHMESVLSHFSLVPAVHTLWRLNFPWGSCCLAPAGHWIF